MQFRINTSGLLETLILHKALSTSAWISAMRRIPMGQHDVLHLLLLRLDKDDLLSRTCPQLFTNSWGPMPTKPASGNALGRSRWRVATVQGRLVHSSECCGPLLGLARFGHFPQFHWLMLNFPAAQEGKCLGGPAQPLLGRASLSQPQFTTFLLPNNP